MKCKAVLQIADSELEELKEVVLKNDVQSAFKLLAKINKAIDDFVEPH